MGTAGSATGMTPTLMLVSALAPGINPGINPSRTQENSGDLAELELMPEQAKDRPAVDLITRRSRVRIPPPLLTKGLERGPLVFPKGLQRLPFFVGAEMRVAAFLVAGAFRALGEVPAGY